MQALLNELWAVAGRRAPIRIHFDRAEEFLARRVVEKAGIHQTSTLGHGSDAAIFIGRADKFTNGAYADSRRNGRNTVVVSRLAAVTKEKNRITFLTIFSGFQTMVRFAMPMPVGILV